MTFHAMVADPCASDGDYITIEQACVRAASYARPMSETVAIPIASASQHVLAETIVAHIPLPPFDQSAMDGYALAVGDVSATKKQWPISARIGAGDCPATLAPGSAARIFTGAPLPRGADSIIAQEHVRRDGNDIVLDRPPLRSDNIRRRGEDILEGDKLFSAGERLDARHLAILAAQGREHVQVYRRPVAAIISTGSELCQPGSALADAAIFDTNRPMLTALMAEAGYEIVDGGSISDDARALAQALTRLAGSCDLIVTTGGASTGDHDHAAAAMLAAGGSCEILKIALKPGKPAVVGRLGEAIYLGLPGNPVAALVSWLLLGAAVTAKLAGRSIGRRLGYLLQVSAPFDRKPGRTEFVPARLIGRPKEVLLEIAGGSGSARLRPLVNADGLAEISPFHAPVEAGSTVAFHPFQAGFRL